MALLFSSGNRQPYEIVNSRRLNALETPEISTPRTELNVPVPFLRGTARVTDPSLVWYGNTIEKVENYDGSAVTSGVGLSGYVKPRIIKLLTDVMFVLATGDDVRLRRIYDGKKIVWSGAAGPAATVLPSARLNGFRYERATFFGGLTTQPKNMIVQKSIPVDVDVPPLPNFNGYAYIVMEQIDRSYDYAGLSFELDHLTNPLALAANVNLSPDGKDLNPMTLLVDTLCSHWNEAGYLIGQFDVPALRLVAAQLATEENFGSVLIREADLQVEEFIQLIEDQTEGVFFESPDTGLLTFKLIRAGDTAVKLHITPSMMTALNVTKDAWGDTPLHARAKFTDRERDYVTGVVKARTSFAAQANLQNANVLELSFPFVSNRALAQKLVSRALSIASIPAIELDIEMDRHGAALLIGDGVEVTSNRYGFTQEPFLVRMRKDQQKTSNKVSLSLTQTLDFVGEIIFPDDEESWVPEEPPAAAPPYGENIDSAPYQIAVNAMANVDPVLPKIPFDPHLNKELPLMKVSPANKWQSTFQTCEDQTDDPNQTVVKASNEYFAQGELSVAVSRYDGFDDGVLAALNVRYRYVDILAKGIGGALTAAEMNDARNVYLTQRLMIVGDEIMAPIGETTVVDGTRVVTYRLLARGLYDTVARDHPEGTPVWYYWNPYNTLISPNDVGQYAFHNAAQKWDLFGYMGGKISDDWLDADWTPRKRFSLPQRPHDTRMAGARPTAVVALAVGDARTITWQKRPRWEITRVSSGGAVTPYDPVIEKQLAQSNMLTVMTQKWNDTGLLLANEYDWIAGEWNAHVVRLEDAAGIVYDLATVKHPHTQTVNVTIPAGVVNGHGRLWVAHENSAGSSDEFAKDWLPVTLSGGIDGLGYGRAYGRYYGGL